MKGEYEDFLTDVENVIAKYEIKDTELYTLFNRVKLLSDHKKDTDEAEKNKQYVGKCYCRTDPYPTLGDPKKTYYKVISHHSSNQFHVETLKFSEHPTHEFKYQGHRVLQPGDFYFGKYEYIFFTTKTMFIRDLLRDSVEITEEEYWKAASRHFSELKKLPWEVERRDTWMTEQ